MKIVKNIAEFVLVAAATILADRWLGTKSAFVVFCISLFIVGWFHWEEIQSVYIGVVTWGRANRPLAVSIFVVFGAIVGLSLGYWVTKPIEHEPPPASESLGLFSTAGNADYPPGTKIAGIAWSVRFVDLYITMVNPSLTDYTDVDLTLVPDEPVAEIAQTTNIPDVSFLAAADVTLRLEARNGTTGERIANPLVLILTTGGYRIRCKSLPHRGRLEAVLAVTRAKEFPKERIGPARPDGGIFDRDYVMKIPLASGVINWFGHAPDASGRYEEAFEKGRHVPKTVRIEGNYNIGSEQRTVSQVLAVKDVVGEAISEIRKKHP